MFILKWCSVLKGFILQVELSAVTDLWAVPVVWHHCTCNQKRLSRLNLYHRGNYHKVHRSLLLLQVGWSNLCSCKILRQSLGPARHPSQPGQAKGVYFVQHSQHSLQPRREREPPRYPTCWIPLRYSWNHSWVTASQNEYCNRVPWVRSLWSAGNSPVRNDLCGPASKREPVGVTVAAHLFWI